MCPIVCLCVCLIDVVVVVGVAPTAVVGGVARVVCAAVVCVRVCVC